MSELQGFLSAIIERPDDDLPRLVFADYLDETGETDRAEFIRLQCELARVSDLVAARSKLLLREAELLNENRVRWIVPEVRGAQWFRRGFIEAVRTSAEWFLESAATLFRSTPLRELRLQNAEDLLPELAHLPGLARIEHLDLTNNLLGIRQRLRRFLIEAPLVRLQTFSIRNAQLWADAIQELVQTPVAGKLIGLELSGNPFGDEGVTELCALGPHSGLRHLTLRNDMVHYDNSIHAGGAAALASSALMTGLQSLDLRGHYIGDAGLISFATSPNTGELVVLDLSNNEIGATGESGIEALVASRHLDRLERLDISRNTIDQRAAASLARWPRRQILVDLRDCIFENGARDILLQSAESNRFLIGPAELVSEPIREDQAWLSGSQWR